MEKTLHMNIHVEDWCLHFRHVDFSAQFLCCEV